MSAPTVAQDAALVAHNALGASSILYYLVAYTLMSLGAFTMLMVVATKMLSAT